jgi:hypothetical protein
MTSTTISFQINITVETQDHEDLSQPWFVTNVLKNKIYELLTNQSLSTVELPDSSLEVSNIRIVGQSSSRSIPSGTGTPSIASFPLVSIDQMTDVWNGSWRFASAKDPDWDVAKSHKNLAQYHRPSTRITFPVFDRQDMIGIWKAFVDDTKDNYWERMKPTFRKLLLEHIDGMVEDGLKDPSDWRVVETEEEVF